MFQVIVAFLIAGVCLCWGLCARCCKCNGPCTALGKCCRCCCNRCSNHRKRRRRNHRHHRRTQSSQRHRRESSPSWSSRSSTTSTTSSASTASIDNKEVGGQARKPTMAPSRSRRASLRRGLGGNQKLARLQRIVGGPGAGPQSASTKGRAAPVLSKTLPNRKLPPKATVRQTRAPTWGTSTAGAGGLSVRDRARAYLSKTGPIHTENLVTHAAAPKPRWR